MKKFFAISAILISSVAPAIAGPSAVTVDANVLASFHKEFKNASHVTWKYSEGYTEAVFIENGVQKETFYDADGAWFATATTITVKSLPLADQLELQLRYDGYAPVNAIRLSRPDMPDYVYVTLAGPKKDLVVEIDADHNMCVLTVQS